VQLYKYLPAKYAQEMLQLGRVKLGTLTEYRKWEDALRGDAGENSRTLVQSQEGRAPQLGRELSPFQQQLAASAFGDAFGGLTFINTGFQRTDFGKNCYVYCASIEHSREAAGSYDSCVRIRDHKRFLRAITIALRKLPGLEDSESLHDFVRYAPREQPYPGQSNFPTLFVKPEKFRPEREYRMAWIPPKTPGPDPLILDVADLRGMLERVPVPK
jgi:hypothetical protein